MLAVRGLALLRPRKPLGIRRSSVVWTAGNVSNTQPRSHLNAFSRTFSGLLLPPTEADEKQPPKASSSVSILPKKPPDDEDEKAGTKGRQKKSPKNRAKKVKSTSNKKRRGKRRGEVAIRNIEQELQNWYQEKHGVSFRDKCITINKVSVRLAVGGGSKWKAQFTDPVTGEVFRGGTLPQMEANQVMEVDGNMVYTRMKHARQAAVARALDCFLYREDEQSTRTRLCIEHPYLVGVENRKAAAELDADLDSEIDRDDDEEEEGFSDEDEESATDDEDEEEYTIQYLSGTSPNMSSQGPGINPLARVIGSWSETTSALSNQSDNASPFLTKHPEAELQELVETAEDWIAQEQESKEEQVSAHRVMLQASDFPRSLDIANSILEGLARANQRVYIQSRPRGVEQVATKILNHLWSTKSAHPNADTYVAYLRCLEGDAKLVADRSKDILDAMQEGAAVDPAGERTMPKPTQKVINAVLQLWAQIGGESGKGLVLNNITEKPNEETFLTLLSRMSYPATIEGESGGFDPIFAQDCINKMNEASLRPDTAVYNAGLRWSGGLQSSLSRPFMRPIPWDSHAEIFKNGFKDFEEDSAEVQDAYRMHAWLEEMANIGGMVSPNIETYEAVIQAYVRTGSLDGVQQAEHLLESLLNTRTHDESKAPRLQTFHPIIGAWAHSGHKQGSQKVAKWIDRLLSLSKGIEQSREFESNIREAPLLATVKGVENLLRSKEAFTDQEIDDMVDTALGCSIHLTDLCSNCGSNTHSLDYMRPVDPHLFSLVMRVWGQLGIHILNRSNPGENLGLCLAKMMETTEEYEGLILKVRSGNERQARHLAGSAHSIYSLFLSTLSAARSFQLPMESDWRLEKHIGVLERWIRRVQEFGHLRRSNKVPSELPIEQIYGDMYSYLDRVTLPEGCVESQGEFLMQILQCLRENVLDPSMSPRRGDMVRLCILVADAMAVAEPPSSTDNTRRFSFVLGLKEVIKTMCYLSEGPEEQDALLEQLLHQLDWLQEKGDCAPTDHDLILLDIRKHTASTPRRRGRSRKRRVAGSVSRPSHTTSVKHQSDPDSTVP